MADIMVNARSGNGINGRKTRQLYRPARAGYFDLSRKAYEAVNRPAVFAKITDDIRLPASVVEDLAFLKANPTMEPDGVTVTLKSGYIQGPPVLSKKAKARALRTYRDQGLQRWMTRCFTPIR